MRFILPCLHQSLRAAIIALMDEMIHEMNRILNHEYEIKLRYDPHCYERNFSNCAEKPVKFRASTVLNLETRKIKSQKSTFNFLPYL